MSSSFLGIIFFLIGLALNFGYVILVDFPPLPPKEVYVMASLLTGTGIGLMFAKVMDELLFSGHSGKEVKKDA